MGKYVDQNFIKKLSVQYYLEKKNHRAKCNCLCCHRYLNLLHEKKKWSFDGLNSLIIVGFLFLIKEVVYVYFQFLFNGNNGKNSS